ncbi:DUF6169 family protein [Fibrella aquatilis]|uniref:Uncharacterized protein n=1 Tax=Fibrella aquatilis TaxID=2817059 RepID=A0A939G0S9_9BACT|nr:DUF6169 family protein [Fibrella aquatilis]MBO0929854.1 hypothetical protein [Fibrella aquatilis]
MEQNSYRFTYIGGYSNVYAFTTSQLVDYEVRFAPSDYLFEHVSELGIATFEMIVVMTGTAEHTKTPADSTIAPTIAAIFTHFFDTHEKVIVYVCDTSDNRQRARACKFTAWFYRGLLNSNLPLAKVDRQMIADDGEQILLSMFIHLQHPNRLSAIDAFMSMGSDEK